MTSCARTAAARIDPAGQSWSASLRRIGSLSIAAEDPVDRHSCVKKPVLSVCLADNWVADSMEVRAQQRTQAAK